MASDIDKIESKIIMDMVSTLTDNETISIYTDSLKIKKILPNKNINFVNECSSADIAILEKLTSNHQCTNLAIITLKYDLLKGYPQSVASFFWQKGRPNIVFIEPRLKLLNIKIDTKFNDYIEQNIW